mgnify:CR=1 FL=1
MLANLDSIITSPRRTRSRTEGHRTCALTTAFTLSTAARQRHELHPSQGDRGDARARSGRRRRSPSNPSPATPASPAPGSTPSPTSKTRSTDCAQQIAARPRRYPPRSAPATNRLRRRLEISNRRNRELADENQRLRRQLANALGQLRRQRTNPTCRTAISRTSQLGNNQPRADRQANQSRRRVVDILHEANPQVTAIPQPLAT